MLGLNGPHLDELRPKLENLGPQLATFDQIWADPRATSGNFVPGSANYLTTFGPISTCLEHHFRNFGASSARNRLNLAHDARI